MYCRPTINLMDGTGEMHVETQVFNSDAKPEAAKDHASPRVLRQRVSSPHCVHLRITLDLGNVPRQSYRIRKTQHEISKNVPGIPTKVRLEDRGRHGSWI